MNERSDDEVESGVYEGILDLNYFKYSTILNESSTKTSDLDSQLQAASSPLQMASMEMMKFLKNLEQSAQGSGDFMDAIVIAIKMLVAHCTSKSTGKPLKYAKKICIFTNGSGDGASSFPTWCPDLIEPVIEQLRMNEITTLVWYLIHCLKFFSNINLVDLISRLKRMLNLKTRVLDHCSLNL